MKAIVSYLFGERPQTMAQLAEEGPPTESEAIEYQDDVEENDEHEGSILPYAMDYLTTNMMYELRYKLKETNETREKGLQKLRELIKTEENLHSREDDNFLLQFLRVKKYDVNKAFVVLKNYYTIRKEFADVLEYCITNYDDVKKTIMRNHSGFLTRRDRFGSIVMVMKIGMLDPDVDSFEFIFGAMSGYLCHAIEYPATQVTGFRVIIDFKDVTFKQIKLCSPRNIRLLIRTTQFCFPARYRGIHILSDNPLLSVVWSVVYPFLTVKLKKRMFFHGKDVQSLRNYVDPSVLPTEFGGDAEMFENSSWDKIIENNKGRMIEIFQYGYK